MDMDIIETLQQLRQIEIHKLGISFCYILVICGFFITIFMGIQYQLKRSSKNHKWVICLILIVLPFALNYNSIARIRNITLDTDNLTIERSKGRVDSSYAYAKGGRAAVIGNCTYYVFPQLGSMETGVNYEFEYLKNSKFIVSFVDLDNPVLEFNRIPKDSVSLFMGSREGPIDFNSDIETLAYKAILAYYRSTDLKKYESFRSKSWEIYVYLIVDRNAYQCNCEARDDKISVHLVVDAKTGTPTHFWEKGWEPLRMP